MSLIAELKRRNVFRVVAAYVVLSWLMLQAGDILFDALGLPEWTIRLVVGLLIIGLVPTVVFSWVYEMTPEGVKKESEVDRSTSITHHTGRKLDYITIGMIVVGLGLVLADRFVAKTESPATTVQAGVGSEGVRAASGSDSGSASESVESEVEQSIAVLPFADMSPDGDQGYFSDGIAEEILNVLVRIDDLKVASRTSSFAYRGRQQNVSDIASELKVRHILEGSVRKAGDRVRITAQLIDAQDDRHLWSETFDRQLIDIFAIQDEIATAIVNALAIAIGTNQATNGGLVQASTSNLNAYDLFLKGRQMFLARDRLGEAIEIMQRAVELDPGFARAWEVLAALYSVSPSWGVGDEQEYNALSDQAAEKALELDPERYFSYAIQSQNLTNNSGWIDWERSLELNQRAIDGEPKNATPYLWRAINYRFLGYQDRAREDLDHCLELDPAYENCRNHLTFLAFETGDLDEAFAWLDRHLMEVEVRHTVLFPFFVPDLVRRGEVRTAYLMADATGWVFNGDARPIRWWIEGMQNPDSDHSERIARLRSWSEKIQTQPQALLWISLGAFHLVPPNFSARQAMWRHDSAAFRRSPEFKTLVRETGVLEYWLEHGFPRQCRRLGGEDYECD